MDAAGYPIDRREFERFELEPGYTAVELRRHDEDHFRFAGHAYDVSEGGIQFELDEAIEMGTTVSLRLDLPPGLLAAAGDVGPGRAIFVTGNVVWCDAEEPGAARMALAVTRFDRAGDRERLIRVLSTRQVRRRAA